MKLSQVISLITLFFLLVPYLSFAQIAPPESYTPPDIPTNFFGCLPTDTVRTCILRLLDKFLKIIIVIALALAALIISYAGLLYLYKGADDKARQEAKNRLIYAAVGLVIAMLAWVITVILSKFISSGSV
jgi:hypothetical protein